MMKLMLKRFSNKIGATTTADLLLQTNSPSLTVQSTGGGLDSRPKIILSGRGGFGK